jgi:DNA topoisomerase-1
VISRQKKNSEFIYTGPNGKVENKEILEWIKTLAVPPAWKDVRISRSKRSKILAVGRDNAGKKQAIYSPAYRARQEELKFDRILRFAEALPQLRKQLEKDLKRKRLNKEKVLACIVKLIDEDYFRVGNERYAKENNSYGITTLRSKHLEISGDTITFDFIGKSGKQHIKQIDDSQLARIVKKLDELPGYEVFRYQDNHGKMHDITSNDVNEYIKDHMGEEFTAKDFRTWGGTLVATTEFIASEYFDDKKDRQKMVRKVVKNVAQSLGNTPAIARSAYIDPRVISAYVGSSKIKDIQSAIDSMKPKRYMSRDELCVLRLLNKPKAAAKS